MKLRFQVDQAECFRRGVDCPKSVVTVEVNPAEVEPDLRELIAQRLTGIDVCQAIMRDGKATPYVMHQGPIHLVAKGPEWKDLLEAVRGDDKRYVKENTITDDEAALVDSLLKSPEQLKKGKKK